MTDTKDNNSITSKVARLEVRTAHLERQVCRLEEALDNFNERQQQILGGVLVSVVLLLLNMVLGYIGAP